MRKLALIFFVVLLAACTQRQNVIEQNLTQNWTLTGDTLDINLPVDVPSVVQQNLYDAGLIPHPYMGTVEEELLWISDHPWTYSTRFNVDKSLLEKEVVELVFEGIDTYASVILNGQKLFDANNQFRIWKQDVKLLLKPNDNLLVLDFPATTASKQPSTKHISLVCPKNMRSAVRHPTNTAGTGPRNTKTLVSGNRSNCKPGPEQDLKTPISSPTMPTKSKRT